MYAAAAAATQQQIDRYTRSAYVAVVFCGIPAGFLLAGRVRCSVGRCVVVVVVVNASSFCMCKIHSSGVPVDDRTYLCACIYTLGCGGCDDVDDNVLHQSVCTIFATFTTSTRHSASSIQSGMVCFFGPIRIKF